MAINVSFAGTSIQTTNILISDVGHDEQANKKINRLELARGDGSKITNIQLTHKQISIKGRIWDTSVTGLRNRLDALKALLAPQGQNLDIDEGDGVVRRYVATMDGFKATRSKIGPVAAEIEISFLVPTAFGTAVSTTTVINNSGISASPSLFSPNFGGTVPTQTPIISLTLTTLTASAAGFDTVSIGNAITGQIIAISRTYTNADVILIDTYGQTVKVNNVDTDFMGAFPTWAPGAVASSFTYSDTFSARAALLTLTNLNRFL